MKKITLTWLLVSLVGIMLLAPACGPAKSQSQPGQLYHCSMHPQIVRDQPGKCPICGMDLVPFTPTPQPQTPGPGAQPVSSMPGMPGMEGIGEHATHTPLPAGPGIEVDARRQQLIGVTTAKAEPRALDKILRVQGEVAHDPDMFQAQAEFLRSSAAGDESGLRSASRLKLEHMGMGPDLIRRLEQRGRPKSNLFVRDQDPTFWVYVYFYEADIPFLQLGQTVTVRVPMLREQFSGVLRGLQPYVEAGARTIRGIVEVRDPALHLYAGLYADAEVRLALPPAVVIPVSAVLDSGTRQVVFVQTGPGRFEPRQVRLGAVSGEFAQVLEGVTSGDQVVKDGNFMLDAESRLQSAVDAAAPAAHQH